MTRRSMVAGSIGAIVTAGAVAIPASCSGQVYPGTRVHGVDIAGNTPAGAEALLRDALAAFEARAVTYTFEGRRWDVSLADLGLTIDYETMIERAMSHGRDDGLLSRYASLVAEIGERDIPLALEWDTSVARATLEDIGREIAVDPQDAVLEFRDGVAAIVDGVHGQALDIDDAMGATEAVIALGEPGVVRLATLPVTPDVTAADLVEARETATRLVGEPVVLTHDGLSYPVDTATLRDALVIEGGHTPRLDATKLAERLDTIAGAVYVRPRNVKLGWDGGLYVVEEDVDGMRVDREALETKVLELATVAGRVGPLPVVPVKAEARTDNIPELGIEHYIASGSSSFAGSSAARAENVAVSARNISFKLVPPGGEFSFNNLLGPITVENGFVEGTIIEGDFVATDIGGGVCQVSTTVFRAAANAGFQFSEWHPHSWRLAFYEADGSPPGYDGAIYQAPDWELDLRFTNPLDSWLLLTMVVEGESVHAHFYGRDNGWTTTIGEPRLSEPKPIPEPRERVSSSLAPGDRRLVQHASAGVTVSIRRTVTAADGSIVSDGDFVSDYRSVPEVWEVGQA